MPLGINRFMRWYRTLNHEQQSFMSTDSMMGRHQARSPPTKKVFERFCFFFPSWVFHVGETFNFNSCKYIQFINLYLFTVNAFLRKLVEKQKLQNFTKSATKKRTQVTEVLMVDRQLVSPLGHFGPCVQLRFLENRDSWRCWIHVLFSHKSWDPTFCFWFWHSTKNNIITSDIGFDWHLMGSPNFSKGESLGLRLRGGRPRTLGTAGVHPARCWKVCGRKGLGSCFNWMKGSSKMRQKNGWNIGRVNVQVQF